MKVLPTLNPVAKSVAVFVVVAGFVTSVTFAAMQGHVTLANNSISSGTAELQIKTDGDFADQAAGFAFSNIMPGGPAVPDPGHKFKLRNSGDADLRIFASIPEAPTFTVEPSGDVDLTKVDVLIHCKAANNETFSLTADMQSLVDASQSGGMELESGVLPAHDDHSAYCRIQLQMDNDAFTGNSIESTDFDIMFTGSTTNGNTGANDDQNNNL